MQLPDKLNICFIARSIHAQDADIVVEPGFLWTLSEGLIELGHSVTIMATAQENLDFVKKHISFALVKKPKLKEYSKIKIYEKFIQLQKEKPFNIVHIVDQVGLLIAKDFKKNKIAIASDIRATSLSKIFYIVGMAKETLRSMLVTSLAVLYKYLSTYFTTDRQLLKKSHGVFVSSPRQRLVLERYYFYPDKRIYTIPYGTKLGVVYNKHQKKPTHSIPDNVKVAVTISDMNHVGVLKNILKAFEHVAIKKTNSHLVIIGDGPKRKQIERQMYNLALGSKVTFTGNIPYSEVIDYVDRSNVFIDISIKSTGFDPAILEAMAKEKVIIGSEVSATSSIIDHGDTGFLIRPADANALSHLILNIFTEQINTIKIGKKAKEKIVPLFDTKNMVDSTIKSYMQMLALSKFYKKRKN